MGIGGYLLVIKGKDIEYSDACIVPAGINEDCSIVLEAGLGLEHVPMSRLPNKKRVATIENFVIFKSPI
jgi:hypothetical protein